jgi:hypothetical protein
MAADATEEATAAKAGAAIQAMYGGAGKDRAALYTGTIEEIGRWSDGSGSVVFQFTFGGHRSTFAGPWPEWAYLAVVTETGLGNSVSDVSRPDLGRPRSPVRTFRRTARAPSRT